MLKVKDMVNDFLHHAFRAAGVGVKLRNKNFTKEILRIPNPSKTAGLYYIKSFIDFDGNIRYKRWRKAFVDGKLKYVFEAIY